MITSHSGSSKLAYSAELSRAIILLGVAMFSSLEKDRKVSKPATSVSLMGPTARVHATEEDGLCMTREHIVSTYSL